jgi:hypothetical protein
LIAFDREEKTHTELVDIEVAPAPPPVEALPEEVARPWEQDQAAPSADELAAGAPATPPPPEAFAVDAGVDAPPDAPPDAAKKQPDAAVDAAVDVAEMLATLDEGRDAGIDLSVVDASAGDAGIDPLAANPDASNTVATVDHDASNTIDASNIVATGGSGSASEGSGSGAGGEISKAGGRGNEPPGAGSGVPGATNEPAVDGAPTTAGTAANLLSYFPKGHVVTALIRFDRLRGTEWAAATERLMKPMPDYQALFGAKEADLSSKVETLVISSPKPKDATATTLVARTKQTRKELQGWLAGATWTTAKGGLVGTRKLPHDKRIFLSPFKGWFLLVQPTDVPGMTSPANGDIEKIEAKGKLPPWLGAIRTIEAESGTDARGPALVLTIALGGQTVELGDNNAGLGIDKVTTPDRVSLAMELVKQGWLVRGNMRFTSDAAATSFIAAAEAAKQRVADSRALQLALGKPIARVVANLSFARTGPRVSYTTSISIADARAILAVAAQQLDAYFLAPSP